VISGQMWIAWRLFAPYFLAKVYDTPINRNCEHFNLELTIMNDYDWAIKKLEIREHVEDISKLFL
jgi:hypothetical protein